MRTNQELMKELAKRGFERSELKYYKPDRIDFSTGFGQLDALTDGYKAGSIWSVIGFSGQTVADFVLSLALQSSTSQNDGIILVTDRNVDWSAQSIIAATGNISRQHLTSGRLDQDDWQSLARTIERLYDLRFRIITFGGVWAVGPIALAINDIFEALSSEWPEGQMPENFCLPVYILDYWRIWGTMNTPSDIPLQLHQLVEDLPIVIVLGMAFRTQVKTRYWQPSMSDLAAHGEPGLRSCSDVLLMLQRQSRSSKKSEESGLIEDLIVEVGFNAFGPLGQFNLQYNPESGHIKPL